MELTASIRLLGDLLGEVIAELETGAGFRLVERVRDLAKRQRAGQVSSGELAGSIGGLDAASGRVVAQAFAIYFELVNVAEDASRVHVLRERERSAAPAPMEGSIAHALFTARNASVPITDVQRVLSNLRVEVVLTSHPIRILRKSDPEFEKIALEVYNPDEKAKILQAILVDVHESYSQCPRALAFSKLWSTETIIANIEDPPIENWVAGT